MESFAGLAIALICLVVAFTIKHRRDQNLDKVRMAAWKTLAEAHHLDFVPGEGNPPDPQAYSVQGEYQGCKLVLTRVEESEGQVGIYTQISMQPRQHVIADLKLDQFPSGRPLAYHEVKDLLKEAAHPYQQNMSQLKIDYREQRFAYRKRRLITDTGFLEEVFKALAGLAHIYPTVLALGGDAIPALQQIASDDLEPLQPVARQLLRDISDDTTQRLHTSGKAFACPNCLTQCAPYELRLGWQDSLTFYGCRTCRQSRIFLNSPLIAVLDNRMEVKLAEQPERTQVNWLRHRRLFDFSEVEIIEATDEEVERFAVQVGNDTDEWRKPRYEQMPCVVSAHCQLSENTLRILERMFGEVKVESSPSAKTV